MKYFLIYLAVINVIALIVTIHDKRAAVRGKWRVSERALLLISALGGAPTMYITMLIIRHKTRKAYFMVGIPLIFMIELAVVLLLLHYVFGII